MEAISWHDFEKVKIQIGTVVSAEIYKEARRPAYIISVDLGQELGIKKSSAQITHYYTCEELIGKQVVCVTNFPPKQIGKIMSEVLITGFPDDNGNVVLCVPDKEVKNGVSLF